MVISRLVPVLLSIGLLPLKMQQSYLTLSSLPGIFLSLWWNSSCSVNLEDWNYRTVFVCPRNCYHTMTVIVSCILRIVAVKYAGSQLYVQHVFRGIPASKYNSRKGPDSQQLWFQHSLCNATSLVKLEKYSVALCVGTHVCTSTLPKTTRL